MIVFYQKKFKEKFSRKINIFKLKKTAILENGRGHL